MVRGQIRRVVGAERGRLGGGNFSGNRLTQPHRTAVPCLTLLHPTMAPLTAINFFAEPPNPLCLAYVLFGFFK